MSDLTENTTTKLLIPYENGHLNKCKQALKLFKDCHFNQMTINKLHSKYVIYKFEGSDLHEMPIAAVVFIIFEDAKDLILYVTEICTAREHQRSGLAATLMDKVK